MFSSRACAPGSSFFFFFNDTATTEIYTLSLHDALPISLLILPVVNDVLHDVDVGGRHRLEHISTGKLDRKSTRLNSSHQIISYAVFCLKKKNGAQINCTSATMT